MAGRLLESGTPLTVWNRTASRAEPLAAAGARVAGSARELAESADVVVTMVSDGEALGALLHGDDGLLAGLSPGSVVVDMSTIGPAAATAFAAEVAGRGAGWLDSPVSGSTAVAARGELTLMVGGEPEALERARPVLEPMAKAILHLGPAGSGAAMKLCIQSALAVINESIAEALVLAERAGISREAAYDVFAGGVVASPYVLYKRDSFVKPDETPVAFTVELMRKDLRLAAAMAAELGVELPAVRTADGVLERAVESGLGEADLARVADVVRDA
jgi:3-hydroxyisobutyrate dehydrogenase/2-hydroxy-3-oxopropionate reductase